MDFFCKIERVTKIPKKKKENEPDVFYCDKFKPIEKDDFIIHKSLVDNIDNTLNNGIYNVNFYGNQDNGKYTLAKYLIRKYFNDSCDIQKCVYNFEARDLIYYKSYYHYELHVDTFNCNIINLVKNFLQSIIVPLKVSTFDSIKNVILIRNSHLLKEETFNLIKFFLDKHYNNIFILISNKPQKQIKSFFTNMRVPSPSELEMSKFLKKIIKKESIKIKKKELNYILEKGERKIFKTLCILQNCFLDGEFEEIYNYNLKLVNYIFKLIKNPSIDGMIKVREYLNNLLVNNISIKDILFWLLNKILKDKKIEQDDKLKCLEFITECEYNFKKGYREIQHLEYCIIRIINLLKNKLE